MSAVVVERSADVPTFSNYLEYREYLRVDFWFACCYCSISETEAQGVGFQIDHYDPAASRTDYANLYWSCAVCNRNKSNLGLDESWPSFAVFLRIDHEDPRDHFVVDEERVVHITQTGEFNIEALDLNRQPLRRLRRIRRELKWSSDAIAHGLRALGDRSLDLLPVEIRGWVFGAREKLRRRGNAVQEKLRQIAVAYSRSELLDRDPAHVERVKTRRHYLEQLQCVSRPAEGAVRKPRRAPR